MKEKKTNSRSFRYTDKVAKILESMEGDSLNEKFENLVLFCHLELPKVKAQLELYQNMAKSARDDYYRVNTLKRSFEDVMRQLEDAKRKLDRIVGPEEEM